MVTAECEPIVGVWGKPQQGPGAEPLVRGQGKLKVFLAF